MLVKLKKFPKESVNLDYYYQLCWVLDNTIWVVDFRYYQNQNYCLKILEFSATACPKISHVNMQAHESPKNHKSTQDTLLKNFDFLHCTQINHYAHHCRPPAQSCMSLLIWMTLEDMGKLFYFMNFFPKLHIFATRHEKSVILTIFGLISISLVHSLTEKGKNA